MTETQSTTPCRSTQHCAVHGFCHRCNPLLAEAAKYVVKALNAAEIPDGDQGTVYARAMAAFVPNLTVSRVGLKPSPYVTTLPDLTHDCTGWAWSCPACPHGEDGCWTRWGARRRQRKHIRTAHR